MYMSGRYSGLHARVRQLNELAIYVPCAEHNPVLVGLTAAECCLVIVKFFGFAQRLYSYFSTYKPNIDGVF